MRRKPVPGEQLQVGRRQQEKRAGAGDAHLGGMLAGLAGAGEEAAAGAGGRGRYWNR